MYNTNVRVWGHLVEDIFTDPIVQNALKLSLK